MSTPAFLRIRLTSSALGPRSPFTFQEAKESEDEGEKEAESKEDERELLDEGEGRPEHEEDEETSTTLQPRRTLRKAESLRTSQPLIQEIASWLMKEILK
jgi:hypothetical protein